jgi:hypothetical protein
MSCQLDHATITPSGRVATVTDPAFTGNRDCRAGPGPGPTLTHMIRRQKGPRSCDHKGARRISGEAPARWNPDESARDLASATFKLIHLKLQG